MSFLCSSFLNSDSLCSFSGRDDSYLACRCYKTALSEFMCELFCVWAARLNSIPVLCLTGNGLGFGSENSSVFHESLCAIQLFNYLGFAVFIPVSHSLAVSIGHESLLLRSRFVFVHMQRNNKTCHTTNTVFWFP